MRCHYNQNKMESNIVYTSYKNSQKICKVLNFRIKAKTQKKQNQRIKLSPTKYNCGHVECYLINFPSISSISCASDLTFDIFMESGKLKVFSPIKSTFVPSYGFTSFRNILNIK